MKSFNHYAYGAIGEWLYNHVAGLSIDPEKPGYKHILFNPHPGGGLKNASAEIKSMFGVVKSAWKIIDDQFNYQITIPANTTATVTLPNAAKSAISLNSKVLDSNTLNISGQDVIVKLGSGVYEFQYK